MASKDRIYSDKHSQQDASTRDLVAKNLAEVEQRHSLIRDLKDPEPVELTRMQRKMRRIFGAGQNTSKLFVTGFQMGAMVGCTFGGVLGLYYAITARSFAFIPMSMLGSGVSMGFFMGMGMVIRASDM